MGNALDYLVELQLFLELAKEEHVTKYKEVDKAGRKLLDAIVILSQRRLHRSLFPDQRLKDILTEADKMVKKNYPDYELAANHISHYRDMELVTFSVDKSYSLVEIFYKHDQTVPLAGMDYYIEIRTTVILMCKSIGYIYYYEELFVVKHKSKHSCASAIFYELGLQQVIKNCKLDYMYNATVPPVILDGGRDVLLANFHGPRSLKCTSVNGGLAKPAPEHNML